MMIKTLLEIVQLMALVLVVLTPFLRLRWLGFTAIFTITAQVVICSVLAFHVFSNGLFEHTYTGTFTTGPIAIRIDYLSAWFILVISFTFLTGAWYGIQYLKKYQGEATLMKIHAAAYIIVYTSLIDICVVQNSIVFLVVWEIMALGSFMLVIFEHYKRETIKAGINFLIQSHVAIVFLTMAFLWVKVKTGSYDFAVITEYTTVYPIFGTGIFLVFFVGFGIKAGFVPFHTWLPVAHPAAPAHISGIMSGVIIKIGIYGILRMLTLVEANFTFLGYFMLFISILTGLYGVMLAIVQHNLKRLLAYHSIENIGIIGIGIGLGCLGIGTTQPWMIVTGFGGALLHTLNHSLFKSLLFFSAGTVYQITHTMNIEALGGLIKKMPRTAILFLTGAVAICGLPPFNGFVSEFMIFTGLYKGLLSNQFGSTIILLFSILALVLIGGLAMICFTKAFGIVFLGTGRSDLPVETNPEKPLHVWPLYAIGFMMLLIGIFPFLFSPYLEKTIGLFRFNTPINAADILAPGMDFLTIIGLYSAILVAMGAILYIVRNSIGSRRNSPDCTWGCGYVGTSTKLQYSASSFVRTYRKLFEAILMIHKKKTMAFGLYPKTIEQTTHAYDKIEYVVIDKPIKMFRGFLNRFVFLQNGNVQYYVLYGFIFISIAILLPLLINRILHVLQILKNI